MVQCTKKTSILTHKKNHGATFPISQCQHCNTFTIWWIHNTICTILNVHVYFSNHMDLTLMALWQVWTARGQDRKDYPGYIVAEELYPQLIVSQHRNNVNEEWLFLYLRGFSTITSESDCQDHHRSPEWRGLRASLALQFPPSFFM